MDNQLAPALEYLFGEHWVLWYKASNCYNVVDNKFKLHLDYYLKADTISEFKKSIISKNSIEIKSIADNLHLYLQDCNSAAKPENFTPFIKAKSESNTLCQYNFNDNIIEISYHSDLVKKVLHPPIAHLETKEYTSAHTFFDLYLSADDLYLLKDNLLLITVPKKEYHKIQGKFMMHLFCSIHNKNETDWLGTFHGSTIGNGISSILFVGESGKGKSTLCALLAANGFDLIADDISPLLANDLNIYTNPAAVSIKSGAFDALLPYIETFKDAKTIEVNKAKGPVKFVPFPSSFKSHYPCSIIVLVNFEKKSKTELKPISIPTLLEMLIPDSWLSPNPKHAKQFLDWLKTASIYQLTYGDNESVIQTVSDLFKKNE